MTEKESSKTKAPAGGKTAWVQLYEARRSNVEVSSRAPGRPPSLVPRHKVGFTLSAGEITELEQWQDRLSAMLGRKVSTGETVGILTRMATARWNRLSAKWSAATITELVEKMIG